MTVNNDMLASGSGFRGGWSQNRHGTAGEGIAGYQSSYTTNSYRNNGGGGGGGYGAGLGGGGGAGGYRTTMPEAPGGPGTSAESALTVSAGPTSYPVIIGAGGAGKDGSTNLPGVDGTDSTFDGPTFTAVTSTGGGGGGSYSLSLIHI